MTGLIEIQQALSHGSITEKLQQAQEGNLNNYQQLAAADMRQKEIQRQREANKANKADDGSIRDGQKRHDREQKKDAPKQPADCPGNELSEKPDHLLDVLA